MSEKQVGDFGVIEFRPLQRDGYCRGCHTEIKKNSEKIIFSSGFRDSIILCETCCDAISMLREEKI